MTVRGVNPVNGVRTATHSLVTKPFTASPVQATRTPAFPFASSSTRPPPPPQFVTVQRNANLHTPARLQQGLLSNPQHHPLTSTAATSVSLATRLPAPSISPAASLPNRMQKSSPGTSSGSAQRGTSTTADPRSNGNISRQVYEGRRDDKTTGSTASSSTLAQGSSGPSSVRTYKPASTSNIVGGPSAEELARRALETARIKSLQAERTRVMREMRERRHNHKASPTQPPKEQMGPNSQKLQLPTTPSMGSNTSGLTPFGSAGTQSDRQATAKIPRGPGFFNIFG